jgi:gas vesicle protein
MISKHDSRSPFKLNQQKSSKLQTISTQQKSGNSDETHSKPMRKLKKALRSGKKELMNNNPFANGLRCSYTNERYHQEDVAN